MAGLNSDYLATPGFVQNEVQKETMEWGTGVAETIDNQKVKTVLQFLLDGV